MCESEEAEALQKIGDAIRGSAMPWQAPTGGQVGDLTEAMVYMGQEIGRIADAPHQIADEFIQR